MRIVKRITVQAPLKNEQRTEIQAWCEKNYGPQQIDETWYWYITSNYTRGFDADFDVVFANEKHAHWFVLTWGGNLVIDDCEYVYGVDHQTFDNLFEV